MPNAAVATDWLVLAGELSLRFAERAAEHDATDRFVGANYEDLHAHHVFGAPVPAELGGGDLDYAGLCEFLRILARGCGSTALALSMHSHLVATQAWRWRKDRPAAAEALLRRVAKDDLVLVSTGGSDWIAGSGRAERVDGGWRVSGRKIFSSASPAGDVLVTCAIAEDGDRGATVLHFPVRLDDPAVRVLDTWHTLGMRGTGSHDVLIDGAFVPDAAVSGERPAGQWHPMVHLTSMIALPIIYAVYLGIAEAARDRALALTGTKRSADADMPLLVGEMENELAVARLAHADMVRNAVESQPGPATTNRTAIGRTLVGRHAIRTVEKALEVAGGAGFYRAGGLERMFRDVQAARYHPLQERAQLRYTGRLALGQPLD